MSNQEAWSKGKLFSEKKKTFKEMAEITGHKQSVSGLLVVVFVV